jgi:hypothetical protein
MIYSIDIKNDEFDEFEKKSDNVAMFKVFDNEGNDITDSSQAIFTLSENALLGLGSELIRLAHNFRESKHVHLEPAEKEMIVQRLGIFLTPDSGRLIIACSELDCIDDYFKKD